MFQATISEHRKTRSALDLISDQEAVQVVNARHRVMVQPDDHISGADSGSGCGGSGNDFMDPHTGALSQLESAGKRFVNSRVLAGNPQVATPNASFLDQPTATNSAVLLPIAKQIPCAAAMIAVLTPITSPRVLTSGPPELPGFSAASV